MLRSLDKSDFLHEYNNIEKALFFALALSTITSCQTPSIDTMKSLH